MSGLPSQHINICKTLTKCIMLGRNNVKLYGQENAVVMFEGNVDIMF